MNAKTKMQIAMARLAYQVFLSDDEDGVSTPTAVNNVCLLQQIATDLVECGDEDLDYAAWQTVIRSCDGLRHVYREFTADTDGETTAALNDAMMAPAIADVDTAW